MDVKKLEKMFMYWSKAAKKCQIIDTSKCSIIIQYIT
jgi:hypothetical protein